MSGLQAMLATARSQLGYQESVGNRTKYGAWYGLDGNAWCAMFVSWCAEQSGNSDVIPKHAYTPSGAQWFAQRNQWGTAPRVGAIVYYRWPGMGRISHVGIVEQVRADGSIVALEGNTNPGGTSRTGGGVYRVVRRAYIAGYGYPRYPEPELTYVEVDMSQLPLLAEGASGEDVQTVQGLLLARARHIDVDGDFGPATTAALRAFQQDAGLEVDGACGPNTWAKLLRAKAAA